MTQQIFPWVSKNCQTKISLWELCSSFAYFQHFFPTCSLRLVKDVFFICMFCLFVCVLKTASLFVSLNVRFSLDYKMFMFWQLKEVQAVMKISFWPWSESSIDLYHKLWAALVYVKATNTNSSRSLPKSCFRGGGEHMCSQLSKCSDMLTENI